MNHMSLRIDQASRRWLGLRNRSRGSGDGRPAESPRAAASSGTRKRVAVEQARQLELSQPGWVVMWSPWRRSYTAFAYFTPVPVVIDARTVDRLLLEMRGAEQHYSAPQVAP
jgi:hypothetical protein